MQGNFSVEISMNNTLFLEEKCILNGAGSGQHTQGETETEGEIEGHCTYTPGYVQ